MNPANFYCGYNLHPYAYSPPNFMYSQMQHPIYGYSQPPFPNTIPQTHMIPPIPQIPVNTLPAYGRPQLNNLNLIPPHPRRQPYKNIQNEFSRGFEFDYEFLPSDSTMPNSQSMLDWEDSHCSRINNSQYRRNENPRKASGIISRRNSLARVRTRSFKTPKIIKSCQRKMTKAGILFTAIIYSVCDCILAPESNSFLDITAKLLQALDGSRFDLSKLMLPHDRLLTEESMEDLEFEILENRANRLEKEENSTFSFPIKKNVW